MRLGDLKKQLDEAAGAYGDNAIVGVFVQPKDAGEANDISKVFAWHSNYTKANVILLVSKSTDLHKTL